MALVIPDELIQDSNLTRGEQHLFSVLLTAPEPCTEENSWFANKLNMKKNGSSKLIMRLKTKGYIDTKIDIISDTEGYSKTRTITILKHRNLIKESM